MPVPIICLAPELVQFAGVFRSLFSKPQWKYFVTVLLGFMECTERRTLSALLRRVAGRKGLSGLSRFLSKAPWSVAELAQAWQERFRQQLKPMVQAEQARQRSSRPPRPGRPKATSVTGFLCLDDSTHEKFRGQAMEGLGCHYSTTYRRQVPGHSLFSGVYVLLGRRCPLPPQLYCQRETCQTKGLPFQSKVQMAVETIRHFEPVAGTHTHVLVDSWYMCQAVRRATRERNFALSGGIRSNRKMRDPHGGGTIRYVTLSDYAAGLLPLQFEPVWWPSQAGDRPVWVHRVRTFIHKFGPCQVLVVRCDLHNPQEKPHFFVTTLLEAGTQEGVDILALRWEVEVMFAEHKDLLGSDHYQLMTRQAIVRFWALVACAYLYLDEQRARLEEAGEHVTLGQARQETQKTHVLSVLSWLQRQFQTGVTPHQVQTLLAA